MRLTPADRKLTETTVPSRPGLSSRTQVLREFVVTKVHFAKTKPYCFVFFNSSRQGVKLNIWSEG